MRISVDINKKESKLGGCTTGTRTASFTNHMITHVVLPALKQELDQSAKTEKNKFFIEDGFKKSTNRSLRTQRTRYLSREEQMLQTNSFKLMRRETHKAREHANCMSQVTQVTAHLQSANITKVSHAWQPLTKSTLSQRIKARIKASKLDIIDRETALHMHPITLTRIDHTTLQKDANRVKTLTASFVGGRVLRERGVKRLTLDLDRSEAGIQQFGLMDSRLGIHEDRYEINYDSIRIDNHMMTMDKDFSSFMKKVEQKTMDYTVPERVIPDPKDFNEFYKVEERDRIEIRPFEEVALEMNPRPEPLELDDYDAPEGDKLSEDFQLDNSREVNQFSRFNNDSISNVPESIGQLSIPKRQKKKGNVPDWSSKHGRLNVNHHQRNSIFIKSSKSFFRGLTTDQDVRQLQFGGNSQIDRPESEDQSQESEFDLSKNEKEELDGKSPLQFSVALQNSNQELDIDCIKVPSITKFKSSTPKSSKLRIKSKQEKSSGISIVGQRANQQVITRQFFVNRGGKFKCVPRLLKVNAYRPFSRIS